MDDDLARRLAALRHSLESENTAAPITRDSVSQPNNDNDDVLVTRFAKMFQKQPASQRSKSKDLSEKIASDSYSGFDKELSVEELINALSSENESWTLDEIDEKQIEQLLADIKTPTSIQDDMSRKEGSFEIVPTWLQKNISQEDIKSDTDAEDILKMVKDEIEFERAHRITMNNFEEIPQTCDRERSSTPKKIELDEDLLKRFEALGGLELPPAPRTGPRTKRGFDVDPVLEESDTWCCICNEDGEYQCSGCENDIYCASCLYEAHTGPNAGYEEKKHKWTKYTKPKKLALC
ncbi:hypothetical protein DFP73DRAFT_544508 [Morchella snyderi]|nr:hypothetical protein DFP73DRAFT_544508 [Morchella snyderi]